MIGVWTGGNSRKHNARHRRKLRGQLLGLRAVAKLPVSIITCKQGGCSVSHLRCMHCASNARESEALGCRTTPGPHAFQHLPRRTPTGVAAVVAQAAGVLGPSGDVGKQEAGFDLLGGKARRTLYSFRTVAQLPKSVIPCFVEGGMHRCCQQKFPHPPRLTFDLP